MPYGRHLGFFSLAALACLLALASTPAQAIQGGVLAPRNMLDQATVGVGTLLAGSEGI